MAKRVQDLISEGKEMLSKMHFGRIIFLPGIILHRYFAFENKTLIFKTRVIIPSRFLFDCRKQKGTLKKIFCDELSFSSDSKFRYSIIYLKFIFTIIGKKNYEDII